MAKMMILELMEQEAGIQISPEKTFAELGIDSLDVIAMLKAIEEAYHLKFTRDEAFGFRSPQDILDFVATKVV